MAPRGLPAPVLQALHNATTTALRDPEVVAALAQRGIEVAPSTSEECATFIRSETEKWAPVIRASGAKPE